MTPADHSPDTAARPRWRALAGPLLAAGYAVWCLALLWLQPRSLLAIASFLLPCYLFICSWLWRRGPAGLLQRVRAALHDNGVPAGNLRHELFEFR